MFFNRACHASKYLGGFPISAYTCSSLVLAFDHQLRKSPRRPIREAHSREAEPATLDDFAMTEPRHMDTTFMAAPSNSLSKTSVPERGPFGSVIVQGWHHASRGCNQVTATDDPTPTPKSSPSVRPAKTRGFRTQGLPPLHFVRTLPMCLGAIYWARIDKVFSPV